MKFFKSFLSFFCTITTAIVFVININFLSVDHPDVSKYLMLQILAAGFVTALATTIFFAVMEKVGKYLILGILIHYVALCAIMVWLSVMFGWYDFCLASVIDMAVSVAIVYIIVYIISYILMKKEADDMNRALRERNKEEE